MTADHPTPAAEPFTQLRLMVETSDPDYVFPWRAGDAAAILAELARRDAALADLTRQRDEARKLLSQVDYALRNLVSLKDGPRNLAYGRDKPHAWQLAREAVTAVDLYRSAALGPVDPEATAQPAGHGEETDG